MNPLVKKEMEYRAKIRALGTHVCALGLDLDDAPESPERDFAAERLVQENPPGLVKDALRFAAHLREMTDTACAVCAGSGVVKRAECRCGGMVDGKGFFVHAKGCLDSVATETEGLRARAILGHLGHEHVPCACAARREREFKLRAQEEAPAFRVKSTKGAELDRRVAEAEKMLAAAEGRRDEAVAPITAKISERDAEVAAYESGRTEVLRTMVGDDEEIGRHTYALDSARRVEGEGLEQDVVRANEGKEDRVSVRLREVSRLQQELQAAKESLEAARVERDAEIRADIAKSEAALTAARVKHVQHRARLANYEAEHEALVREVGVLRAARDKVARHHEPKIEKARRRLSRLKYVRGDGQAVTAEDVKVSFAPGGVG